MPSHVAVTLSDYVRTDILSKKFRKLNQEAGFNSAIGAIHGIFTSSIFLPG
jgi:hypothetical protein